MTDPLLIHICENSQAAQMPTAHCLMHHPFKVVNVVTRNGISVLALVQPGRSAQPRLQLFL